MSTDPVQVIRDHLAGAEIEYDEISEGVFAFSLPGEKKLQTAVRLDVGKHALGVHAFVCRGTVRKCRTSRVEPAPGRNPSGVGRLAVQKGSCKAALVRNDVEQGTRVRG